MSEFDRKAHPHASGQQPCVLQRIGAFVGEAKLERYEDLERAQDKRERMTGLALLLLCAAATFAATVSFVLALA